MVGKDEAGSLSGVTTLREKSSRLSPVASVPEHLQAVTFLPVMRENDRASTQWGSAVFGIFLTMW